VFECALVVRYGVDFDNVATTRLVATGLPPHYILNSLLSI